MADIERIAGIVKAPTGPDIDESVIYHEAGRQLRHYSSNRLAIYSISIPLCFGIGAVALSSTSTVFRFYLFFTEIIIFCTSIYAAIIFSTLVSSIRSRLINIEQGGKLLLHTHIRNYFINMHYDLDKFDSMVCILGAVFNMIFIYYLCTNT